MKTKLDKMLLGIDALSLTITNKYCKIVTVI